MPLVRFLYLCHFFDSCQHTHNAHGHVHMMASTMKMLVGTENRSVCSRRRPSIRNAIKAMPISR